MSNLNTQLKTLEQWLGFSVFFRHRRDSGLTL